MLKFTHILLMTLTVALGGACDAGPESFDLDEQDGTELRPYGGMRFNTNAIGTHRFDELKLDGTVYEGVRLLEIEYTGWGPTELVDLSTLSVYKGEMTASTFAGTLITHKTWERTTWKLHVVGQPVMINMFARGVNGSNGIDEDVPYYNFAWAIPGENPVPTCTKDPGGLVAATVYRDIGADESTGDINALSNTLNIACLDGALGKAYWWNYGYHELVDARGGDELEGRDWFQAAVRMIRADITGTSLSYTAPGNPVSPVDNLGISTVHAPAAPIEEAVWDESGAICADSARDGTPLWTIVGAPPRCNDLGGAAHVFATDPGAMYWTNVP
jgi:hypothetical protein